MPEDRTTPRGKDRTWMGLIALTLLCCLSILLIDKADSGKPEDWSESRLTYLPSGKLIKPFMMDLDEAAGDLLWINAMIYFADAYLAGKGYTWLGHMLDVVTILHPHLYQAYEFGGVVLTKEKPQLPKTLRLLDRGIETYPKDWKIRLYAAMAQVALDSDYAKAAEYIKPVTLDAEVPDHIRTLCASFLSKGGGRHVALAFLVDRYLHSTNAINREIFVQKILKLYPADHPPAAERADMVSKILHEVTVAPDLQLLGLGVMNEYLADSLSENGRKLIDVLRH